jgi:hypothetical protein
VTSPEVSAEVSAEVTAEAMAEAIAEAVRRCPAVADLHSGGLVQVATYLPGRRIDGVRLEDDRVLVSVVAAYGVPLLALTEQVRAAALPLSGGRRVDIHVADLRLPGEEPPALPPGSGAGAPVEA